MNAHTFDMLIGPRKTKSVLGIVIASVTVIVLLKRVIGIRRGNTSEFKNIPMPKGKFFYLGKPQTSQPKLLNAYYISY